MKNIKLKLGYLVKDWTGEIEPVKYTTINYLHYGTIEERFLYVDEDGNFSEPITRYNSDKIFDSLVEAEKHSAIKKKKRIEYYEKQVKEYSEKLEECRKS